MPLVPAYYNKKPSAFGKVACGDRIIFGVEGKFYLFLLYVASANANAPKNAAIAAGSGIAAYMT